MTTSEVEEQVAQARDRYDALRLQADSKLLTQAPNYPEREQGRAWLCGYEMALRDIADGSLQV